MRPHQRKERYDSRSSATCKPNPTGNRKWQRNTSCRLVRRNRRRSESLGQTLCQRKGPFLKSYSNVYLCACLAMKFPGKVRVRVGRIVFQRHLVVMDATFEKEVDLLRHRNSRKNSILFGCNGFKRLTNSFS